MKYILIILGLFLALVAGQTALADQGQLDLLKNTGGYAKYQTNVSDTSLANTVGNIIKGTLGLLGIIFLAYTVYAGYLYLTAGGDEEQIKTAQKYIKNGIIGIAIVLSAYGITSFVVSALVKSALTQP